jgi:drug/metabolite transporter (DMT)-like permease
MNFFWDAFLAAIFSAMAIIVLKYICIESNENVIRPIINLIGLLGLVIIVAFIIGNLSGNKYFQIIKPSLDMTKYENKMFWIAFAYSIIAFIFVFFSIRSFYYSENPAYTQAVVYSNLILIYLFSVYFFGTKITINAALGILLVFVGVSLISMNK